MAVTRFAAGDRVQTLLGKGVVREVRNSGRLLIDVSGRAIVIDASAVRLLGLPRDPARAKTRAGEVAKTAPRCADVVSRPAERSSLSADVDLHGLTVDEALTRAESVINDALLADRSGLRLIHGRSGGRIRAALHRRLREIPAVRAFQVDPHNAGVTVVRF